MNECRLKRFSSGHVFNKGSKQQSSKVTLHKIWIHSSLTSRVNKLYITFIVYSFKIALFFKISFTIRSTSSEFRITYINLVSLSYLAISLKERQRRNSKQHFQNWMLYSWFSYWTVKEWRAKQAQRNWKPSRTTRRLRVQKTPVLWNVFWKLEKPIKITFHHISRHFFGSCEKVAWTAHASRE